MVTAADAAVFSGARGCVAAVPVRTGICGPAGVHGAPINVNLATTTNALVNLRVQGVISGSSPLNIFAGQPLVNGSPSQQVVTASAYPGSDSISICLRLQSFGFDPAIHLTVEVPITLDTATGGSPQTTVVPVAQVTGPLVNEQDSAQLSACQDPNQKPIANAGQSRSVADTDGQPGENVTLDGSGSSDPDGAITDYQWSLVATGQILGSGPSPTLGRQSSGRGQRHQTDSDR